MTNQIAQLRVYALLAAIAATATVGCDDICGDLPNEDITHFDVTITTGSDATDADIFFCAELSSGDKRCEKLGNRLVDDWDVGETGEYRADVSVKAGKLARVGIENRGDAPSFSFDGNDWELEDLKIVARTTGDGSHVIVDAEGLGEDLNAGDEFYPDCRFDEE